MQATAWCDGSGNGDLEAACACCIYLQGEQHPYDYKKLLPTGVTNMVAEYEGVILALSRARALGVTDLEIRCDNQTVVYHLNGKYKVKNQTMKPLFEKAVDLGKAFNSVQIHWTSRDNNKRADYLCREALGRKRPKNRPGSPKRPPARPRPVPLPRRENPFLPRSSSDR